MDKTERAPLTAGSCHSVFSQAGKEVAKVAVSAENITLIIGTRTYLTTKHNFLGWAIDRAYTWSKVH